MAEIDAVIYDFFSRLDKGEARANQHLAKAYERALTAYDAEMKKVLSLIERDGPTASRSFQYSRLQALSEQAAAEMARYGGTVAAEVATIQQAAGTLALESSQSLIGATAPDALLSYATLPQTAVERQVGALQDGSPLRSLTQKYAGAAARDMNTLLIEGIALGRGPLETARLMRDRLGVNHAKAKTLVRTEQMRVFRETNRLAFEKSPVVKGWKWFAVLDKLSCPICWAMHGRQFKTSERMATHPNCRCVMLPVTKTYAELGIAGVNEPEAPEGFAKQSRKGRLAGGQRFRAADTLNRRGEVLFDSLSQADKEFVLGKAAARAYDSGLVRLSDFVQPTNSPLWGKGATTRSLSSILGKERARALQSPKATGVAKPGPVTRPIPQTRVIPSPVRNEILERPNFTTVKHAEDWAKQAYPNVEWNFDGAHLDAISPVLDQFEALSRDWPEVTKQLKYFGTNGPLLPKPYQRYEGLMNNATALADREGGEFIIINRDIFGRSREIAESFTTGAGKPYPWRIRNTAAHEYGHLVDGYIERQMRNRAYAPVIDRYSTQNVGDGSYLISHFQKRNKATSELSRYATTNDVEAFAEAFGAIYTNPEKLNLDYVQAVDTYLKESKNIQWYENPIEWDDATPEQRAEAKRIADRVIQRLTGGD